MTWCRAEFGCDCEDTISQLTQELATARAALRCIAEMPDKDSAVVALHGLIRFVDPQSVKV